MGSAEAYRTAAERAAADHEAAAAALRREWADDRAASEGRQAEPRPSHKPPLLLPSATVSIKQNGARNMLLHHHTQGFLFSVFEDCQSFFAGRISDFVSPKI